MDDDKAIIHDNMWDFYINEKHPFIKGRYYMEVSGSDRKKVLWKVVDDHVVEG